MTAFFRRITIIGLGLMGGSWGLALKKHGFSGTLAGCDRPEVLSRALAARAIDEGAEDPAEAARNADLVILAAPVGFLHHTSWQVDDIDEIGRGAMRMLETDPGRHVWGLGRHHAGSNFFWYLKDPAGNFSEYYSDMDCIVNDQLWTPEALEGAKGLFNWGPPPPPSFLAPEDLAALMTGAHSTG